MIILTNDDGIDAPGLLCLELVGRDLGTCVTVAPDRCHSSMSHRVTTAEPIVVRKTSPGRFQTSGTPADCARLAITCLAQGADWLISGINRGGNLGADTYLSGTVAAAREAALLGVSAIAISQYVAAGREVDWEVTGRRARAALARIVAEPRAPGVWWNINLPHPTHTGACEIRICPLDPSPLDVKFAGTGTEFRYCGKYHERPRNSGKDVALCFEGYITATKFSVEYHNFCED